MMRLRKSIGLAALAAMVLSASAEAGPAGGALAPSTVATQATRLIADLNAQSDTALPIVEVQHRHRGGSRHGGRNAAIVGGIVLGTAAAIALSQGANAAPRRDGYAYSCRRWAARCDDGEGWACRRYRREC